jgi:ketosteroid isomerase-like protein
VGTEYEQLIRDWADVFSSGDIDAALGFIHPEVELHDPERVGGIVRGHDGYRAFAQEWLENFDEFRVEIEEIEEGPDGIFVACTNHLRGRGSGLETEAANYYAIRMRDGKVAYIRISTHAEEPRREVGLD